MADDIIDIEGFEKYGPIAYPSLAAFVADTSRANIYRPGTSSTLMRLQGLLKEWISLQASGNPSVSLITGLQGFGAALAFSGSTSNGAVLMRNLPANYSRIMAGFAISSNLQAFGGVAFFDGSTAQCSLWVDSNGRLNLSRGAIGAGTILWTSAGVISAASRNYVEIDITIHNTTGAAHVWLDGAELISLTGINTRGGSNNYLNACGVGANDQAAFDDIYWRDNTGGTATPFGDRTVYGLAATGDSAVDFSPVAAVIGNYAQLTVSTNAPGANQLALVPVTPVESLTINSVGILPQASSGTAKFAAVIYADSAGAPAALLSNGTEVVGCTANTPIILDLSSPTALTGGTQYWVGIITDTSIVLQQSDNATSLGRKKSNTYTSGAPDPAGSMTASQPTWLIWGGCSGGSNNYTNVNGSPPPLLAGTALAYNASGTPGDVDLYSFDDLPISPEEINLIKISVLAERSDSGSRTLDIVCKSGTSTSSGDNSGITPATSMTFHSTRLTVDPDTSSAWTESAVNNMTAGPSVAS